MKPLKHPTSGFVLVAVLWFIAIVTLIVSAIAVRMEQNLESSATYRQQTILEEEAFSVEARLKFWLATRKKDHVGLWLDDKSVIQANGTVYAVGPRIRFTMVDRGGFLNLTHPDPERIKVYLRQIGVEERVIPTLVDRLLDYIDADDNPRSFGAELFTYQQKNEIPPTNYWILNTREIWNVLGWSEALNPTQKNWLMEDVTELGSLALNPNVAGERMLMTIPHVDQRLTKVVISERQKRPFQDLNDFARRLGESPAKFGDPISYSWDLGQFVKLTFWLEGQSEGLQISLWTSSVTDRPGPWAVENQQYVAVPQNWLVAQPVALDI